MIQCWEGLDGGLTQKLKQTMVEGWLKAPGEGVSGRGGLEGPHLCLVGKIGLMMARSAWMDDSKECMDGRALSHKLSKTRWQGALAAPGEGPVAAEATRHHKI